jgi:hypothetical protein
MNSQPPIENQSDPTARAPFTVRLPGFVSGAEIGLGDVIKKATSAVGIEACDGCQQRAETLNQWLVFTR